MKKSKFIQGSKDILSRSFNPAKCKTSLKLAGSRLKLLRNKKEVQVKQMKREIAELLESGQDQTARIRVEHVVREDKMMAAYELIQLYCELMVARLPVIESQKNCPIDLKEAIASIVFASPRCGDVPELLDVRKQITAKYGKDFTTAATELRPASGVGRMLVEKLSATAPDGPTKIKILSAIAEEHNVKWEHKSFDEKDPVPSNDSLSGSSTYGGGNKPYAESSHSDSPYVQAPPSNNINGSRYNYGSGYAEPSHSGSANVQDPPNNNLHGSQFNPSQQDVRTSVETQSHAPAPGLSARTSSQPDETSPDINTGRQNWAMEFKDATAAAQAAAESAERASMAARAAAEIASGGRIRRQYSTESRKPEVYDMKDEGSESYFNTKVTREHLSEERVDRLSSDRTRFEDERTDGLNVNRLRTAGSMEDGHSGKKEYSQSASLKSKASVDHGVPAADGFSQDNYRREDSRGREGRLNEQSFKHRAESPKQPEKSESIREERIRKQPSVKSSYSHSSISEEFKPEAEGPYGWVEKSESIKEERVSKQPSVKSSRSHSNVSDEVNIFAGSEHSNIGYDVDNDPFAQRDFLGEDSASLHFDKFDSDGDDHGFDDGVDHGFDVGPTYDDHESDFHLPSPSRTSSGHLSLNRDSWGVKSSLGKTSESTSSSLFFTRKNSSTDFSENIAPANDSEQDNFKPVTFDDSDGPDSDSDEEINMSKHKSIKGSSDLLSRNGGSEHLNHERGSSFEEKEYSGFDREHVSPTSNDELEIFSKNERRSSYAVSPEKSSFKKSSIDYPASEVKKSPVEPNFAEEPDTVSSEGLNFGKLTGGFRHKGHFRPPYLKHQSDDVSSPKEETTSTTVASNVHPAVENPSMRKMLDQKNQGRTPQPESDFDSDSSEEEVPLRKKSGQKLDTQELHARNEVKPKLRLGPSKPIFDSDDSDLDDDAPKKSISIKAPLRGGQSRRTKAVATNTGTSSYSKMQERSRPLDTDSVDRKPTTTYISDTPKVVETYEQPAAKQASKPARSNYWGPPESPYSPKTSVKKQEPKSQVRSESHDADAIGGRKPRTSPPKTHRESAVVTKPSPSVSSESPKAAAHSNGDDGARKATHVHPKLPDYDFLVQSLRKNRS